MPGKSFYRRLKEAVRGSDKDFELGVLQEQLGRDWEAVKAAGFETNKALLRAHRQAADHIAARNTKAAGKAIEDLRTRHADTQTAQTVLDPIAARGETPKYPKNSERASDQADVNWVPDAGWKQAVALEAGRDADFLKQTQESAATRRPGTEGSEDRSRDAQVKMKLDTKRAPMQLGRATFASKITVAGQSFGAPEFLGEGGFGTAARYTSPEGSSVVVKAIPTASQADLERELAINKRLAEGPADALGRENVLLMKGYVKGDDGTAYILMDEASGDLNSMKHAMNA